MMILKSFILVNLVSLCMKIINLVTRVRLYKKEKKRSKRNINNNKFIVRFMHNFSIQRVFINNFISIIQLLYFTKFNVSQISQNL
ncbi:hypothetical protein SADUNF_Sadunf12G0058500 [Salix dunnii]|uniref:Uncharacterized protein n=1 Tax=Salix dunnii TaxID=1413687 RepID=A0A835MVY7_9ROSI|nr:hypothetical protein SADUNF_Sadunf12G0058500 [Salix dunnii]